MVCRPVEAETIPIYLELVTQDLSVDLGGDALIIKMAQLGVIIDLQLLLAARGRVSDVELHGRSKTRSAIMKTAKRKNTSMQMRLSSPDDQPKVQNEKYQQILLE